MGQRLKEHFKSVVVGIKNLKHSDIQRFLHSGFIVIEGHRIDRDEIRIIYTTNHRARKNLEVHSNNELLVLIDMTRDDSLIEEGLAREVINRIQKLKKKASLVPTDPVDVYYELFRREIPKSEQRDLSERVTVYKLEKAICSKLSMIESAIKSKLKDCPAAADEDSIVICEMVQLKEVDIKFTITSKSGKKKPQQQNTKLVHVVLADDIESRYDSNDEASISLVNTLTMENITWDKFVQEIEKIFGIYGVSYSIYKYEKTSGEVIQITGMESLLADSRLVVARSKEKALECFQSANISGKFNQLKL